MWQKLCKTAGLSRRPIYGDYGIQNPVPTDVGFLGSANIRYTLGNEWAVFRGEMIEQANPLKTITAQFKTLCKMVQQFQEFSGADFCWADAVYRELRRVRDTG